MFIFIFKSRKTPTLPMMSGATWIHLGTLSVHELHRKGIKCQILWEKMQ